MKRTVILKLDLSREQSQALLETQRTFAAICNALVPFVVENRCWNNFALHHLAYRVVRERFPSVGAQMVCNAMRKVCASYKALRIGCDDEVKSIVFRESTSVHYCARTYSMKREGYLSLFSVSRRIRCRYLLGITESKRLQEGKIREGELVRRNGNWYLHLVVELPDVAIRQEGGVLAVDLGENNLATTSTGTIYGGGELRDKRDRFLDRRRKLQSNGTQAAKRCLRKISGREQRHVREVNHLVSKAIVKEAIEIGARCIVMEDLTNIRKRVRGNKRMRTRLHRWAWYQLQEFVEYKAKAYGIEVVYLSPAYTSLTCSCCGCLGHRQKHRFTCSHCGSWQHSDRNACQNLCKLAESVVPATAPVNVPMVAATLASYKLPASAGSS